MPPLRPVRFSIRNAKFDGACLCKEGDYNNTDRNDVLLKARKCKPTSADGNRKNDPCTLCPECLHRLPELLENLTWDDLIFGRLVGLRSELARNLVDYVRVCTNRGVHVKESVLWHKSS